ncbi:hypothetical protein SARC_10363 [Sphaeroforma arctica JP610]|uniref:Uncharacterized protein n=1 Tax=Sphaeroforma arctica JP610 TaxID=667725 RepID=A0A0L0FK92_9EUKA|nr:hypothetical protein SARC_10363 [Sphaeroforma arctica JP610]KNC77170.1 hypothetical protein SARC_10363 [Sphaeroforma arctica JP610]|eukprot:XP_014151072.1 hypothetical protein SARC_10363 [Sphaeroforma arctica JP610]
MTEDVYGYVDMERTMLGAGSASINVLHPGYNIMVTEQDRGKSLKQLEKARSTRIRRNSEKNLMVSNVQHKKSQSLSILEGIAIHSISNDSTIPNN